MSRVALVTGGAVRVGRAITLALADSGWDVVVNYHSSEGPARELAARLDRGDRRALAIQADVADPVEAQELGRKIRRHFGRLDLVVNNASLFRRGELLEIEEEEWDEVIAVNLKGPLLVVQATADLLAEAGGSIINILDLSAFQAWTSHPHHSVSKAALLHLTRVMARALAPRVRVNAIAPGTVLPPEDYTEAERVREEERAALGKIGSPEDVARTVLFLADAPFITGEVVVVDGGRSLR